MERRRERRYPVMNSPVYSDCMHMGHAEKITAMAANISSSGACLYTQRQYDKGETMSVCSQAFGSVRRDAVVCWSRQISEGVYKVGILLN